jgi:hypothetical protein
MQTTLRTLLTAAVVTAAAALASHPAMASTATANVPFSFTASGKVCPAGTYTVQLSSMGQVVSISNPRDGRVMEWLAGPGNPNPNDKRVVLLFDQAGSSHILRSVQYGSAITSRLDKNVPAEQPPTEILGQ